MATGEQTKPLPLALLRGRARPPLPMWSQHKQARTKDFKAATHRGPSETSPVMWLKARCTQTGSLAKQHGRWPCQFWSAANQRLSLLRGGHFGGSGQLPRLVEHLLLSNMPTRSPQRHNRPLIHTPSSPPPSLSPPARWDQTHARCLINTKTCQRCPVIWEESCETSNYHTDLW